MNEKKSVIEWLHRDDGELAKLDRIGDFVAEFLYEIKNFRIEGYKYWRAFYDKYENIIQGKDLKDVLSFIEELESQLEIK